MKQRNLKQTSYKKKIIANGKIFWKKPQIKNKDYYFYTKEYLQIIIKVTKKINQKYKLCLF